MKVGELKKMLEGFLSETEVVIESEISPYPDAIQKVIPYFIEKGKLISEEEVNKKLRVDFDYIDEVGAVCLLRRYE